MSVLKRVVKNSSWLSFSQILNNVLAFIWTIYIARYLSLGDIGVLNYALAFTGFLSIFVDLGLSNYTTLEVSKDSSKEKKILNNIPLIKVFLSFITLGALAIFLKFQNYSTVELQIILLISIYVIISSFSSLIYSIFQAYEKMEYQAAGNIICSLSLLIGFLMAIYLKKDLVSFGFVYVIASIITLFFTTAIYCKKFNYPHFEIDWAFWKKSIRLAAPFGISSIFVTIYFWIDSVMLFYMQGSDAVGIYSLAYKLLIVLLSIYSIYMVVIFPVMTKFHEKSPVSLKIAFERSFNYFLIIGFPIAIITTIFSHDIILFVYKKTMLLPAVIPLQILIWAILFMFINGLTTVLLNSTGKQYTVTKITGIGAIFNISLNIILIPIFSYIGASTATVMTEILISILFFYSLSLTKYKPNKKIFTNAWRIMIPAILLTGTIFFLKTQLSLLIIPVTLIIYILMLIIAKALKKEDLDLFLKLIPK